MKYIKQFGIILGITLIGELLKYLLPLPIPASIYGLVLLLILLLTKAVRLEQVKEAGEFLIEIMPLMFIPAGVGLMASWEELSSILVPVIAITVASTFLVMLAAGKVSDALLKKGGQL
jgi:holin-like protein